MSSARAAIVIGALGAGAAAWWFVSRERAGELGIVADNFGFLDDGSGIFAPSENASSPAGVLAGAGDTVLNFFDSALQTVGLGLGGRWLTVIQRPENATIYQALLQAELNNQIPSHMLVRLAWQESKYNAQAYNASGATGIMQIIPRWHPGVDATDPLASIAYAGKFLSTLFRRFGNWENALQAYNWGANNLQKHLTSGAPAMPSETKNYSRLILADLGASVGYA